MLYTGHKFRVAKMFISTCNVLPEKKKFFAVNSADML